MIRRSTLLAFLFSALITATVTYGSAIQSNGSGGNGVPSGCTNNGGILSCPQFISTYAGAGGINDGGANFSCPNNPASSSPCLFAPQGPLEQWATNVPLSDGGMNPSGGEIWMTHVGALGCLPGGSAIIQYGYTPDGGADVFTGEADCNGDFKVTGFLYANGGRFYTTAADVYVGKLGGALLYIPASPGGLQVYNTAAADIVDVDSAGNILLAAGATKSRGTITLNTGTGTATVRSGAVCVCSETTDATKTVKCAVSSTTLTATGTGSDVIAYICL